MKREDEEEKRLILIFCLEKEVLEYKIDYNISVFKAMREVKKVLDYK